MYDSSLTAFLSVSMVFPISDAMSIVKSTSSLMISSDVYVLTVDDTNLSEGMTTLLRSNVLTTIYLMVISSILPKSTSFLSGCSTLLDTCTISPILNSLVENIIKPATRLDSTSLKANHIPIDIPPIKRLKSIPTILKPMNSENTDIA